MSRLEHPWLLDLLACPRDHLGLEAQAGELVCAAGHRYPVFRGIPVMLVEDAPPTHPCFGDTFARLRAGRDERPGRDGQEPVAGGVDPFVREQALATCGAMYRSVGKRLDRYPVPVLPREADGPAGGLFLDVGANWGRWALAAARRGFRSVAVDPSLEACLAGARVSRRLGHGIAYIVGDARLLPFREESFDLPFSYSVLQHLDKQVAARCLAEMARVCRPYRAVLVQMPNKFGPRQAFNRIRQAISREANPFRVRYWSPQELQTTFEAIVGPVTISVDGFFSLNARAEDMDLLPLRFRVLVAVSERLRTLSGMFPPLAAVADSLWVRADKPARHFAETGSIPAGRAIGHAGGGDG